MRLKIIHVPKKIITTTFFDTTHTGSHSQSQSLTIYHVKLVTKNNYDPRMAGAIKVLPKKMVYV